METKLCVPINFTAEISGRLTSNNLKGVQIAITKCNSSLDLSRPCANDTEIQARLLTSFNGVFLGQLYTVNPLINPGNINYIDY